MDEQKPRKDLVKSPRRGDRRYHRKDDGHHHSRDDRNHHRRNNGTHHRMKCRRDDGEVTTGETMDTTEERKVI